MCALLRQVADPGHVEGARWANMRVHRIKSDLMLELGYSSKLNAEWKFLTMLRDEGRKAAEAFLTESGRHLGVRSSLDLDVLLDKIAKTGMASLTAKERARLEKAREALMRSPVLPGQRSTT